jgi:cell division protease FtsH
MNDQNAITMRPTKDIINGRETITVSVTPAAARVVLAWNADQRLMAIHEAAHCVAAAVVPSRICVKSSDIKGKHGFGRTDTTENDDDRPTFTPASRIRDQIVVALAGLAAEELILGEGTNGSATDLASASRLAIDLIESGLDPSAPFVSLAAFSYAVPVPEWLRGAVARSMVATLADARERARTIVSENENAVIHFAGTLFRARRLSDEAIDAALVAAGIDPPPRNG